MFDLAHERRWGHGPDESLAVILQNADAPALFAGRLRPHPGPLPASGTVSPPGEGEGIRTRTLVLLQQSNRTWYHQRADQGRKGVAMVMASARCSACRRRMSETGRGVARAR